MQATLKRPSCANTTALHLRAPIACTACVEIARLAAVRPSVQRKGLLAKVAGCHIVPPPPIAPHDFLGDAYAHQVMTRTAPQAVERRACLWQDSRLLRSSVFVLWLFKLGRRLRVLWLRKQECRLLGT